MRLTQNQRWLVAIAAGLAVVWLAAILPSPASHIVGIAIQLAVLLVAWNGVAGIASPRKLGGYVLLIGCAIGGLASVAAVALPADAMSTWWPVVLFLRQLTFLVGLTSIIGFRRGLRADHHSLDAGIIAIGVTVCAWAFVVQPRFDTYPPPATHHVLGLSFAVLDFMLLWSLARVVTCGALRTPAMLVLTGSGLAVLAANLFANADIGRHGFQPFQPAGAVYLAWQVSGVLVAAALHMRVDDGVRDEKPVERMSRWRLIILVAVAVLTPAVPVLELSLVAHVIPDRAIVPLVGLATLTCILLLLLVARLVSAVRLEARRADAMNEQSAVMTQQTETLRRTVDSQHVLQTELAWRATHDPLTRVGNRALLTERLTQVLGRPAGPPAGALLMVDLDDFKAINDLLGHPAGDHLLIQVGQRLTSTALQGDSVARLGGDEFAMVIDGCDPSDCRDVAQTVVDILSEPYVVGERRHELTASVGLVILTRPGQDAAGAQRDADLAMYSAKHAGGNQVVEFAPKMRIAHDMHTELAADVRSAVAENRLTVAYQPIVDVASGRTVAVEALLRWRATEGRSCSPGEFIAIAEDIGLVADVGAEVLDIAAADVARWRTSQPVVVSVNVSGRQLMSPTFADEVMCTLERRAVPPTALVLEITETVLIRAGDGAGAHAMRNLDELRSDGVRIAVDDFGTGYSSLAYLQRLPIDILKVDRMFTSALDDVDDRNVGFVGAILGLGASLGLPVVAEGVESARQAALLRELGCPFAQGFYYARPCPSEQVADYFGAGRPDLAVDAEI